MYPPSLHISSTRPSPLRPPLWPYSSHDTYSFRAPNQKITLYPPPFIPILTPFHIEIHSPLLLPWHNPPRLLLIFTRLPHKRTKLLRPSRNPRSKHLTHLLHCETFRWNDCFDLGEGREVGWERGGCWSYFARVELVGLVYLDGGDGEEKLLPEGFCVGLGLPALLPTGVPFGDFWPGKLSLRRFLTVVPPSDISCPEPAVPASPSEPLPAPYVRFLGRGWEEDWSFEGSTLSLMTEDLRG
jgi:hypothetical protein